MAENKTVESKKVESKEGKENEEGKRIKTKKTGLKKTGENVEPTSKKEEKPAEVEKVVVTFDNEVQDVIEWNKDSRKALVFDHKKMLELPDSVVDELRHENAKSYWMALGIKKDREERSERVRREKERMTLSDPLKDVDSNKLKIRKRKGYHQAWKREDEVPHYKEVGYRLVREPKKKQAEEGYEPGYEDGDILKIGYHDKAELVAMECPEELFKKHEDYVVRMSKGKSQNYKDDVREQVERAGLNYVDDEEDEVSASLQ